MTGEQASKICAKCGMTVSPGVDRCGVCHAPTAHSSSQPQPDTPTSLAVDGQPTAADAGTVAYSPTVGLPVGVLQPGQQFGPRYSIIRLLGSGGMASVYQAWDETLGTAVALKLIRVDASTPANELRELEERFKRELKLARQVTHPNVVRIHDLGEVGTTLYLTMEYVQGANLAAVLQRDSPLPLSRALALARQIGAGLAAAHRAGIVHRDLKPSNVMVNGEDHALLMDFGIARSTTGVTAHTGPGSIVGTVDYMAPEQARGEPADQRTDVYGFGLILYELLSGRRPRTSAEGGLSNLIARLEQGLPPLRSVKPDVPAAVERIVEKCLAPDRTARYPSANEVIAALNALDERGQALTPLRPRTQWSRIALRVAAVVVAASITIAGTWWLAARRASAPPPAPRAPVPILIVDFENLAGDSAFDGVLEQALSIAMEGAPFITVFPRREAVGLVRDLKLGPKLNENAGRLLANREGIPVILAGSIDRSGTGYRIAVRAVAAGQAEPLTVATVSVSDKAQVLGALRPVANDVREALGDTTLDASAETFTATSLEAARAYMIAQDLASSQKDSEAIQKYTEALRHDPQFGRAYAGLAASLLNLGRRDEAKEYFDEALRRTDRMTNREKLRTYGAYYLGIARNYDKAIETFEELVRQYPSDSAGHNNLAVTYFNQLNFVKAFEHGRRAIEIYPKTHKYRSNYALYAMYAGDFSTAASTAQALIDEDPGVDVPYLPLAMSALARGDSDGARATYRQAAQAGESGASLSAIGLADVAMLEARHREAIPLLRTGAERDEAQGNAVGAAAKLIALAEAHAALNESALSQATIARARRISQDDGVLVPAARMEIAAGRVAAAREIAATLAQNLSVQSRAYARLIEGEIAMRDSKYPAAIDAFNSARKLADYWLVRFALGIAYFHRADYPEALSEFEKCRDRRGEATALFLDDLPTFRYYATLPYWLGRAREMQKLDARAQFQEFLEIRRAAVDDPLVEDARKRLAAMR